MNTCPRFDRDLDDHLMMWAMVVPQSQIQLTPLKAYLVNVSESR
jgi:hypothetical protein